MTNVTISISISQLYLSWVAIYQFRPPMVPLSHSLYDTACSSYECFFLRTKRLWNKLLEQGYVDQGTLEIVIEEVFSAPEQKLLLWLCVVRRPSVVVNFSNFRLLLGNRLTEFNQTWQDARSQRPLPSLCFSGRSEKQVGRPSLWLAETFSTSSLKPMNRIQLNLTGSRISTSSTKYMFFGSIEKTRWPPWPLIRWDIFDFFSETAERNSTKLDRKQDLNVFYQVWASC